MKAAPTAAMLAQAHVLLNAPVVFGHEIGINLPAFLIALIVTTILCHRHQGVGKVQRDASS